MGNGIQQQFSTAAVRIQWPQEQLGAVVSMFVLTSFFRAVSEGSGRSSGIHIVRDWVWGRPLGSRPSSKIWQMFVSTSHQQHVLSEVPHCAFHRPPQQPPRMSSHPAAALLSEYNSHREARRQAGFWDQLKLDSTLWPSLNTLSLLALSFHIGKVRRLDRRP